MNLEFLPAHFDRISDSPGAIPRFRLFVLDLAVRGKLVQQDPRDEPASELLKRIQKEKARLIKEQTIRSPRILEASNEQEKLFPIPASWIWCRLSEIGSIIGGGTPPSSDSDNFAPPGSGTAWLTPADLGKHTSLYISHGARDLTAKGLSSSSATVMPNGSVLFTSRAPIGYTAIALNEVSTNQGFKSVLPFVPECNLYIAVYFRAFRRWIDDKASGTTFREVSGKIVARLPFPLPPLAEQRRIVAKLDELMALFDRLETAHAERERCRERATLAFHHHLNSGANREDARKHGHLYIRHLPTITSRPEQIPSLREAILNLAVRGHIVTQDERDESVSVLLEQIRAKQRLLVGDGTIPKPKPLKPVTTADLAFQPPPDWQTVNFGELCNVVTSGSRGWAEYYSESGPKFIRAQNIRFGKLRLDDLACVNPPKKSEGMRTQVANDDLLVVITGAGVTNPALLDKDLGEAYVSQHVGLIKPTDRRLSRWLLLCLMAPMGGRAELVKRAYGAGKPGLNLDNIRSLPIPLPPLAEQQRIVHKVNELMELCGRLEAQLTTARFESHRLLEAVLNKALNTSHQPTFEYSTDRVAFT